MCIQITKKEVDLRRHNEGPLLCKVKIEFDHLERLPTESLNNSIRLVGIRPQRSFPIHVDPLLLRDSKLNHYNCMHEAVTVKTTMY